MGKEVNSVNCSSVVRCNFQLPLRTDLIKAHISIIVHIWCRITIYKPRTSVVCSVELQHLFNDFRGTDAANDGWALSIFSFLPSLNASITSLDKFSRHWRSSCKVSGNPVRYNENHACL